MHLIENANYTGAEVNGDEMDNPQSQVSQSSRDESSARDMSTEDSPSESKDKKFGLWTPSFLKKIIKEKKKPTPEAATWTATLLSYVIHLKKNCSNVITILKLIKAYFIYLQTFNVGR